MYDFVLVSTELMNATEYAPNAGFYMFSPTGVANLSAASNGTLRSEESRYISSRRLVRFLSRRTVRFLRDVSLDFFRDVSLDFFERQFIGFLRGVSSVFFETCHL